MGFPCELVIRHALEHAAGCLGFVIHLQGCDRTAVVGELESWRVRKVTLKE